MTERRPVYLSSSAFLIFCLLVGAYGAAVIVAVALGYLWWSDKPCKPRRDARLGPVR